MMAVQNTLSNEDLYLQQKLNQLASNQQAMQGAQQIGWTGSTTDELRNFMASLGMTPEQHFQRYGQQEGLTWPTAQAQQAAITQTPVVGALTSAVSPAPTVSAPPSVAAAPVPGQATQTPVVGALSAATQNKPPSNEDLYLQQKLSQLSTDPQWAGKTADELRQYMASVGLTPEQHFIKYGKQEGLTWPTPTAQQSFEDVYLQQKLDQLASNQQAQQAAQAAGWAGSTTQELKDYMQSVGLTPTQHYQQFGKQEGLTFPKEAPTTVENLYLTYAGRQGEPAGIEHWKRKFGAEVDPAEALEFKNAVAQNIATGFEPSASKTDWWQNLQPSEKIAYFNQYKTTPSQLRDMGVPQSDIDWMKTQGYNATPNANQVYSHAYFEYMYTNPTGGEFFSPEDAQADYDRQKKLYPGQSDATISVNKWVYGREPAQYQNLYRAVQTGKATIKAIPEAERYDAEGNLTGTGYGVFDENGKLIPGAEVDPNTGVISVGTSNGVLRMATPIGAGGVLSPIKGENYLDQVKYQSYGHSNIITDVILPLGSIIPNPFQPAFQIANAAYQLDQGNELGAILSGLGAAGNLTGGQLFGMTDPSSAAAVSGLDLASDIATLGVNPAIALQTTLSDINLAKTAVSGLNAAATGNVAGLINSAMSGYTQLGGTLPSGITTGLQVANLASALDRGDAAGALNIAGDLTGSGDARVAASAVQVLDALKSGNSMALFSAATNFGKTAGKEPVETSMPGGGYQYSSFGTPFAEKPTGITARTYDDTIVQAGADAFIKAKQAGASDADALAAANAVTQQGQPKYDQGEFAGLEEAQKAAKERMTVNIGNAEADTPEEAMALARARNPNATYFNYGGQQYTISASQGQMADVVKQSQLAEIRDLPTFNEAFAKARDVLGPNQTFEWNGKQYSTATFAERPDLSGNVVPGAESTTAGAGRGSYAGYSSAEEMVNKVKSTPSATEYGGAKILGIPVGTPQDALDTVNRMGDVVLDFSRGIGAGFGNFMNQVGTLAHIASASLSGGDTKDTLIAKDNLLSTLGKDLAGYYNGMTTEESKKEWKNIVSDVKNAPEYLKPFVAVKSTLQNFGGFVNQLGTETGEEIAPLLTGLGIGSKILQLGASGTAKTIAVTTTLGDMAESAQGSYDNVMERLKNNKNLTDEEKHWKATQAAAGSMAATAVFGYGANSYLAKSIMGDMIATPAQKVLGPLAVEYITEYPESFVQTLNERFAEKGSIDANDLRDANTDGAISALLGAKTSGTITGTVQVVGKVTNEFVGAESGDKSGLAIIQSPDGKIGFVPAGDLKVGQELNADNLKQLDNASEVVDQFNFNPEESTRIKQDVQELDSTREQRQQQADEEASSFNPSQIDINSALQTKKDVDTQAQTEAGVTSTTDPNTGVTTTTDPNTGVSTTIDPNTGVNTQTSINTNNNTQTTTTTNTNTNTTTQTVVNANTNTTTETSVNNNTNVTTEVTNNTNTETTVTTDVNNNTQTTVVVNAKTGDVIKKETTDIPSDWKTPDITPVTPPVTPSEPPTTPPDKPSVTTASPTRSMDFGLAAAGAAGLPSYFGIDPQDLPSRVTQKAIDPIQRVMEAQAELEKTAMMQQIDPRLLGILQQRAEPEQQMSQQQQFDRDIGALAQVLSGQPAQASNDGGYYSYGAEDSIDDILGGRAANYAEGGYVEPLKAAEGGMALPLLAKSGGALSHYGGREDFKEGKHVAGEGDGQSDDIPAWLADGEFVFSADVVAALGNGSTKAGTDKLYEMMHEIRKRARSTGPKDLPPPALKSPLDYLKSHKRSQ